MPDTDLAKDIGYSAWAVICKAENALRPGGVYGPVPRTQIGKYLNVRDGYTPCPSMQSDERRAAGLCPNHLMLFDPVLGDVCLTDPVGASSSFFDTKVSVRKV